MRKVIKVILMSLASIVVIVYLRYLYVDHKEVKSHKTKQIGEYLLDITKTDMGIYSKDSLVYRKLSLHFYENGQFEFSNSAPFIYKRRGYWEAHGAGLEWNKLFFDKTGPNIELSQCCNLDSTIVINGLFPEEGKENIQELYFKKIRPDKEDLN